ncbi:MULTISPECIES: deoxyribose-phosphate aldolase [Vagococcus]|uniref:Deoxyribose-phosphate aldolase n=1 Tax=Vagococcus fluvialis bH819 TaxID=1255619 RepID=A0A1X6WKJ6_9ENTE|nr:MULTISPECIES: deoxyribose-phosphate aldolase [Vagococcus]SLM84762.1 Deoxyribose-phosphate aldolase [Vagococcus fluvialis bH819]HCM89778.1 deoxyribose-phosphate aldolase [Vagococcus sp.]
MTNLAKMIDHTKLKADTTQAEIATLTSEAKEHGFWSVCINPVWIPFAKEELAGSDVKICTVIGFPLGANSSKTKAFETNQAIIDGADEVDMVINVGALKQAQYDVVLEDIKAVVNEARGRALVKVIIETALLTKEEIVKVCQLSVEAGANYVKTSTGFSTAGAIAENVKLMKDTVGDKALVKASGGVRTTEDAEAMVAAGASRIGASDGVKIIGAKTNSSDTSGY